MFLFAPYWAAGWLLGTVLQLQQSGLPDKGQLVAIALAGLSLAFASKAFKTWSQARFWQAGAALLASTFLALAVVNARCIWQSQLALSPHLEGQSLNLVGWVASLPQAGPQGVRFLFKVKTAQLAQSELANGAIHVPEWIEMAWFDRTDNGPMLGRNFDGLKAGDVWRFNVRLKAPHGNLNPHGFDYELWLWEQGIMATGAVRSGPHDPQAQKLQETWQFPMAQARQWVRFKIYQALATGGPESLSQAGVIAALVMGDQSAIVPADWDLFRATGVAHLMSISGLHITLFAWAAMGLMGFVWRSSAKFSSPPLSTLCLRWPAPQVAMCFGLGLATLYALFSGWGLPAQRTVVMLGILTLLKLIGGRWPWYGSWGLTLWVVVAWDPWALMQPGFWLSFVAVGVLLMTDRQKDFARTKEVTFDAELVQQNRFSQICLKLARSIGPAIVRLVREQWVVTVALTPLSVLFFGQVSGAGLVANLLAIPWVTLVVTPLALAGVAWPPLWQLAALSLQPLFGLLRFLSEVAQTVWTLPMPPISLVVLAIAGGILLLMRWPLALRCWGLPMMLPALFWQTPQTPWGQFEMWAADVGQGNAVILKTRNHVLLYDAGPQYSENNNAGQRVLVPMLTQMGLRLNKLVLSHRDLDHTGGAPSVLLSQKTAELWSSIEVGHPLSLLRSLNRCEAGQQWEWDGVQFEFLHPMPFDYEGMQRPNALSCVLRIKAMTLGGDAVNNANYKLIEGGSALLVGDIEAGQESALLQRLALGPVDFLLVPHHGSQTSSTSAFIETVRPKWAMVQSGYRNRYGHPAPKVIARYQAWAVPLVLSTQCGAAHWQSLKPDQLDCERVLRRRYWHHNQTAL